MDNKLIQIMPAPAGIYAITYNDAGNQVTVPPLAIGLTDQGEIKLIFIDLDDSIRITNDIYVNRR